MHCVAVCYIPECSAIFIVRRQNREILNDRWEFGCAKASVRNDIQETLVTDYKNEFGLDIDLYVDPQRKEDPQPVPIALYSVQKGAEKHKGIIFLAKILNSDSIKIRNGKYKEYRLIAEKDVDSFDGMAVPDFKQTLKKAFDLINTINESGI